MWRSKKFISIVVLAVVVIAGSIGGVALAQTENGDDTQPQAKHGAMLDKVCDIYEQKTGVAIDQDILKESFAEARSAMQTEALQNRLNKMVEEGTITQEQADEYSTWQQARPDLPDGTGFSGMSRMRGFHGMRGFAGMRGFGGQCTPAE